ncbi:hypothetical protein O181_051422 [Austropuccinia psidii MF-1]|uniref:Uncharacterized protein n=1 Tax=Austropuccinia psidii MF-1 TaxID=1389203 RepID=A0A9Q3HPK1_9BASI|nr:hypothetical protein [Austropuccinia psidii MF-1]
MEEANQLQKDKGQMMTSELINYVILKLIILFYLQTELKLPQNASVDIYKAIQKAYNNSLKHKEYQILADLWKNCMNSYLNVRKFLGHPNTSKLLNEWHPFMEKKDVMILTEEWRKNNPPPPKQVPKTAPIARSSNSNMKSSHKLKTRAKARHQPQNPAAKATGCHGKCIPNVQKNDGITEKE